MPNFWKLKKITSDMIWLIYYRCTLHITPAELKSGYVDTMPKFLKICKNKCNLVKHFMKFVKKKIELSNKF